MKNIFHFLIFASLFTLLGCPSNDISKSEFVKQSEIYQSYILNVYEDKNEVQANVFFRFGGSKGTTLKLNDSLGSSIHLNAKLMIEREDISGAHYTLDQPFTEGIYQFQFIDADKKQYKNAIVCNKFNVYNFPKDINRNEDLELNFVGQTPSADEIFICDYKDTSMTFSSSYKLENAIKNNKVFVPKEVFSKMKNGPITLQFYRKKEIPTKEHGSFSGTIKYVYIGNIVEAQLIGKMNNL